MQATSYVGSGDFADEVRVATDDQLVSGTRKTDVEAFTGSLECDLLVDDEHGRLAAQVL